MVHLPVVEMHRVPSCGECILLAFYLSFAHCWHSTNAWVTNNIHVNDGSNAFLDMSTLDFYDKSIVVNKLHSMTETFFFLSKHDLHNLITKSHMAKKLKQWFFVYNKVKVVLVGYLIEKGIVEV